MNNSNQKIKILFVITKSNFGGAQKYVYDLAVNLPKDKFEVVVVAGAPGILINKLSGQEIRTIAIPSLGRDVSLFKDITSFIELWKIFRAEQPDIIHLNSAKASTLGALAGRLLGVPKIIFTAHGWAFNENRPYVARLLIKIISWATVILCHQTIAVSDNVMRCMHWIGTQKKMIVIRNGIEQIDFLERGEARKFLSALIHAKIPPDAFLIGTIAELHPSKGLEYAIETLAKLIPKNPYLYYIILGDGQEKEHLDALIKRPKMEDRVYLAGFVKDAARYLKALDLFILPSTTEALGYVLLEAGLAKLPIVATAVGGIPEIVENGVNGLLVPPRNPQKLAQAIEQITKEPQQGMDFGRALNNKVMNNFTLDRVITQTISLYTEK